MDSRLALLAFSLTIFSSSQLSTADDPAAPPECATKLLVCEQYLGKPDIPPTSCCNPLKDLVAHDRKCLCGLLENKDLLKLINVTLEQALQLPRACGIKADVSLCGKGGSVPVSVPAAAATSPPSIPSTNDTSPAPASNSTKSSASSSYGKIGSEGAAFGLIAFLMALFV